MSRDGAMSRVNVLHVVESLRFGGAERACVEICSRLDPRHFAPHILTYRPGGDLEPLVVGHGIPWTRVERRGTFDLRHLGAWRRLLPDGAPAIVHTHLFGANVWGEVIRRTRRGVRHISHVHQVGTPSRWFAPILDRWWVRGSDLVLAVSDVVRSRLVDRNGYPADRVVTLYNGVDLGRFRPAGAEIRREACRRLGLPPEAETVGIVAAFRPEKDHETFLDAAARVAAARPQTRFLVVGEGTLERTRTLRQRAQGLGVAERVDFLGRQERVEAVLEALDVAVLCSRMEAMPLVVLEYMAAGLPVVCTDVGGIPEILGRPPCGRLVPPGDPVALAREIVGILLDPEARSRLSADARRRVEERFEIGRMVRALEEIYLRLAAPERPRAAGRDTAS